MKLTVHFPIQALNCPPKKHRGDESTVSTWKWYHLMDEVTGGRPSVTPPGLISSFSQDTAVVSPLSLVTHERHDLHKVTPKRWRIEANDILFEVHGKEWKAGERWWKVRTEDREREREQKTGRYREIAVWEDHFLLWLGIKQLPFCLSFLPHIQDCLPVLQAHSHQWSKFVSFALTMSSFMKLLCRAVQQASTSRT